jgi:hypothetical protein
MEAPANGHGRYTDTQIRTILTTACTGVFDILKSRF